MPSIFISHASADKPIIDLFFDLVQTGCNIRFEDIFCTSIDGAEIETGSDFVDWINKHIHLADLVILIVTPNYFASKFCVAEMGATWALEKNVFPTILPNMPRDIGAVMIGRQTAVIDQGGLDDLRDRIMEIFPDVSQPTARWSVKKEQFLENFRQSLMDLPEPQLVDRNLLDYERERTREAIDLNTQLQAELNQLREKNKLLEQTKDKEDVERIRRQFMPSDEEFSSLVKQVNSELRKLAPVVVRSVYASIKNRSWAPTQETWRDWDSEIEKAIDSDWIEEHSRFPLETIEYQANREHPLLRSVFEKLVTLDKFIENQLPHELREQLEEKFGVLIDIGNRDFWERIIYRGQMLD